MRVFILLLFAMSLFAIEYDSLLMRAQASVFPKIMLLDKNIDQKLQAQKLLLTVVYNANEKRSALKLQEMIEAEHKDNLGELDFEVRLVSLDDFDNNTESSAYYIFNASSADVQGVIDYAKKHNRLCFGYNYKDFENGVLISLFVKEKTYIYLNKEDLGSYEIKFVPIFYKIAKVR